jgi:hypothetical protein
MGNFRFYKRVSIFPGLSINVSKSGPSLTVGMRGAHVTVGSKGIRKTVGIPGTGIYYTSQSGYHSGGALGARRPAYFGQSADDRAWDRAVDRADADHRRGGVCDRAGRLGCRRQVTQAVRANSGSLPTPRQAQSG